jgi:hypothetical protein
MLSRSLQRGALVVAAAVVAATAAAAWAAGPWDEGAAVGVPADRQAIVPGDIVAVYDVGAIDPAVIDRSAEVANQAGGWSVSARSGSLGMRRVTRGGTVVHTGPAGFVTPMVYTAIPAHAIGWILGTGASSVMRPGEAVLNELSAQLMGAQAGDVIELETRAGAVVGLVISAVVPNSVIGGAELLIDIDVADRLGETEDTRTIIFGFDSRQAVDAALAASGLEARANTQVRRSWDATDPDGTLSTLRVKLLLGEAWYRLEPDGSVTMHDGWKATNLTPQRVLLNDQIQIYARCHVRIVDDLRAAFAEVAAAGLGGHVDVANANTYGGCYNPRFSRDSWFLSRHAYAMAIDFNTDTNCQGCVPTMNCDVVRIFRRHNFAWGGNFVRADGMHFEWVGTRRDQLAYPSPYCPNVISAAPTQSAGERATLGAGVLVIDSDEPFGHLHEE